jgi:hypothetical protein
MVHPHVSVHKLNRIGPCRYDHYHMAVTYLFRLAIIAAAVVLTHYVVLNFLVRLANH